MALGLAALGMPALASAQQRPPATTIEPAPNALTQNTYIFNTAEQQKIRVTVVAKGLKRPWAVAFLPSGDALISERGVALRFLYNATGVTYAPVALDPEPVVGLPPAPSNQRAGLHDVVLHPQFAENKLVYFTYNKPGLSTAESRFKIFGEGLLSVMRGRLAGNTLTHFEELFVGVPGNNSGSRLAFGKDGVMYVATGSPFYELEPQQLDSDNGKVLRLTADGKVPTDNPFIGRANVRPEIYSYGHCTQYGLAVHPVTGAILSVENGPVGGDELNLILPGRNYGWPKVSFGRREGGSRVSASPVAEGIEQPLMVWLPGIAPSGLAFYTGSRFPAWKGNLFVGYVRRGRLSYTGGLERVVLNEKLEELQREALLTELHQRIRDVRQGPDGLLYILTDGEEDGALLRIEPA